MGKAYLKRQMTFLPFKAHSTKLSTESYHGNRVISWGDKRTSHWLDECTVQYRDMVAFLSFLLLSLCWKWVFFWTSLGWGGVLLSFCLGGDWRVAGLLLLLIWRLGTTTTDLTWTGINNKKNSLVMKPNIRFYQQEMWIQFINNCLKLSASHSDIFTWTCRGKVVS